MNKIYDNFLIIEDVQYEWQTYWACRFRDIKPLKKRDAKLIYKYLLEDSECSIASAISNFVEPDATKYSNYFIKKYKIRDIEE